MHTWAVVVAGSEAGVPPAVRAQLDDADHDEVAFPRSGHGRWASDDGTVQVAGWWTAPSSPGAGSYWDERSGRLTAFSGRVWLEGEPWRPDRSWAQQLGARYDALDVRPDVERLNGSFTLLHLRPDGSGWLTADPLGIGLVYVAEGAEATVYANRAGLAASLVTPPGRSPARDLEAMGWLATTGSMQEMRTGFTAVRVIPQASIVRVGTSPTIETWSRVPWAAAGVGPVRESVEEAHERLARRIHQFVPGGPQRSTCELTGGKDSRLVLALLLGEGLADDVRFVTWGDPDHPDVVVASALADRFDLDLRAAGRRRRHVEGGAGSRVMVSSDRELRSVDDRTAYRHHGWLTGGALSLADLRVTTWPPPAEFTMCGFFGEPLRTNFPSTGRVTTPALLRRYLAADGLGYDVARLIVPERRAHHLRQVEAEILDLVPPGGDVRDGIDGWYLRERKRLWIGLQAELDCRNRSFPLYDLATIRLAFGIGAELRRAEALPMGVMEACVPGVSSIPFSTVGGSRQGVRWDRLPVQVELSVLPLRRALHRSRKRAVTAAIRGRRSGATVAAANRVRDLEAKRMLLRSFLDLPAGHPTWEIYDRRRTFQALDRIEDLTVQGQAEVHHAATVAMWLGGRDRRADLFGLRP